MSPSSHIPNLLNRKFFKFWMKRKLQITNVHNEKRRKGTLRAFMLIPDRDL